MMHESLIKNLSVDDLVPVQGQTITSTKTNLLSIRTIEAHVKYEKSKQTFCRENVHENFVCLENGVCFVQA